MTIEPTLYLPPALVNPMQSYPLLPSRFMCYMADYLKGWFSTPNQLLESALSTLLYSQDKSLCRVKIQVAWPDFQQQADMTPCVTISSSDITVQQNPIAGTAISPLNGIEGALYAVGYSFDTSIDIRTSSFMSTQLLGELILLHLDAMKAVIAQDASLAGLSVNRMTVSKLVKEPGDSTDIFNASILCTATSMFSMTLDTEGPLLKSVDLMNNHDVATSNQTP